MESLTGRSYGPATLRSCTERVGAYVEATGDDPDRWTGFAPPSYAAVALFTIASRFLDDPEVAPHTRALIHADQTFRWFAPWPTESDLVVAGTLDRVRRRGETWFVTLAATIESSAGERVAESASTFLMSARSVEAAVEEEAEPPVTERGQNERPALAELPAAGDPIEPLAKSASRLDLIRYAGAGHDWNPIHLDHAFAVAAGLPGVVVHGLLMAAWATQAAARYVRDPHPLREARFRFRAPLRPAAQATVVGSVEHVETDMARLRLALNANGAESMVADVALRRA